MSFDEVSTKIDRGPTARPEGEGVEPSSTAERGSSPRPSSRQTTTRMGGTSPNRDLGALSVEAPAVKMLHACVGLELIKPLGGDWQEIGQRMRDIQRAMARAENAGMRHLALSVDDKRGANAGEKSPQARLYAVMLAALQAECAAARDALTKTSTKKEHRAMLMRAAELSIPSVITDASKEFVWKRWSTDRKAVWLNDKSIPSFSRTGAIVVRATGWSIEHDGKGYVFSVKLHSGTGPWVRFAAAADGGSAHAQVRRILNNKDVKGGDCKLVWVERKRTWLVRLSYGFPAPNSELDPSRVLAVHRGIRSFLTWADSDGGIGVLDGGADIVAMKGQMLRRRREQRSKIRSGGAGGHGRARIFRAYEGLGDKESRWVKTKIQQTAAACIKRAVANRCGTVALEDYSAKELADNASSEHIERLIRKFPFYALAEAITWSAKKAGVEVVRYAAGYNSVTCPACGNVDAKQDDKRGTFTCSRESCGLKRNVDGVAAWNAHRVVTGKGDSFRKHKAKLADAVGVLRAVADGDSESIVQKRTARKQPRKTTESKVTRGTP